MKSVYFRMAQVRAGRIALHAMACCTDHHVRFHMRGICREMGLSKISRYGCKSVHRQQGQAEHQYRY